VNRFTNGHPINHADKFGNQSKKTWQKTPHIHSSSYAEKYELGLFQDSLGALFMLTTDIIITIKSCCIDRKITESVSIKAISDA